MHRKLYLKTLSKNFLTDFNWYFKLLKYITKAFKKQQSKLKEEKSLPGLDFTADQLFFISAAQVICIKIKLNFYLV